MPYICSLCNMVHRQIVNSAAYVDRYLDIVLSGSITQTISNSHFHTPDHFIRSFSLYFHIL